MESNLVGRRELPGCWNTEHNGVIGAIEALVCCWRDLHDELITLRAEKEKLEQVAEAARSASLAAHFVHTPERDYIDIPRSAWDVLQDALASQEAQA